MLMWLYPNTLPSKHLKIIPLNCWFKKNKKMGAMILLMLLNRVWQCCCGTPRLWNQATDATSQHGKGMVNRK